MYPGIRQMLEWKVESDIKYSSEAGLKAKDDRPRICRPYGDYPYIPPP